MSGGGGTISWSSHFGRELRETPKRPKILGNRKPIGLLGPSFGGAEVVLGWLGPRGLLGQGCWCGSPIEFLLRGEKVASMLRRLRVAPGGGQAGLGSKAASMLRRLAALAAPRGWGAGLESKLWREGRRDRGEDGMSMLWRCGEAAKGEEGASSRLQRELDPDVRVGCSAVALVRREGLLLRMCWEEDRPSFGGRESAPWTSSKKSCMLLLPPPPVPLSRWRMDKCLRMRPGGGG